MVSTLTLQGLDETEARHASYEDLAKLTHRRFAAPAATRALFGRIVFDVLCGDTHDYARNHVALPRRVRCRHELSWLKLRFLFVTPVDGTIRRLPTHAVPIRPQARTSHAQTTILIRDTAG